MAKLPSFQFYPGDWMKDPDLRRCSKAAKGVWMDMLCLMFECPIRGVLANAGGGAWSDQEIAESIGGPIGTNLECIAELLAKEVARRNNRGAIFSRRLVRDEDIRQAVRNRVQKHRDKQKSNSDVTHVVTELYEDEYEDRSYTKETASRKTNGESVPCNSDVTVETIAKTHPKFAKPFETERAIVDALDRLGDKMGVENALNYLLTQTEKYRKAWERWPKDKQEWSPESLRWFASGCFAEDEKQWESKIQLVAAPGYKPTPEKFFRKPE